MEILVHHYVLLHIFNPLVFRRAVALHCLQHGIFRSVKAITSRGRQDRNALLRFLFIQLLILVWLVHSLEFKETLVLPEVHESSNWTFIGIEIRIRLAENGGEAAVSAVAISSIVLTGGIATARVDSACGPGPAFGESAKGFLFGSAQFMFFALLLLVLGRISYLNYSPILQESFRVILFEV